MISLVYCPHCNGRRQLSAIEPAPDHSGEFRVFVCSLCVTETQYWLSGTKVVETNVSALAAKAS